MQRSTRTKRPLSGSERRSALKPSTMITSSNSLCRERDAQPSGRCSTSHNMSVPELSRVRTELHRRRILTTVPPHPVQADSHACAPSLPWQCFCVDASLSACTDVASPDYSAPLLEQPPQQERNKELPCLLMCPSRCLRHWSPRGIIPRSCRSLTAMKPARSFPMINT